MVASELAPDFELAALAVFAVNDRAMFMPAHDASPKRHGLARAAMQSAVRIAADINAAGAAFADERAAQPT